LNLRPSGYEPKLQRFRHLSKTNDLRDKPLILRFFHVRTGRH
jgi:hypothetical protein